MSDKSVTVFEEIRRDLDVSKNFDQFKVPMSYVFGKGSMAEKQSFGGLTFAENSLKVDQAIQNTNELNDIWNRSHSQWTWKHINMSYHSDSKNMRQIAAEIAGRKKALTEAKWNHVEKEIQIKKLQEKISNPESIDYWTEVESKVAIAKLQEEIVESSVYIEGGMKDILALNEMYEQLKEKLGAFSENDIEKLESKAHLKRSLVQCIRDVRQTGFIGKGEQEYLEQIGVNPSKTQILLREYVKKESQDDSWDISLLYKFVDDLTEELIEKHKVDVKSLKLRGFDPEHSPSITHDKKVALLKKE